MGELRDGFGALPNLVVIGAMKCGTSALHSYLDRHPQIDMSKPKELNFFFGPTTSAQAAPGDSHRMQEQGCGWSSGNWHRGSQWYSRHFRREAIARGESSPGYTSPSHHGVAQRMARAIPAARLIYLVRDPVDRAISQYRHHRSEGTESRPIEKALLDPDSQYLSRGRYYERLAPFLECFARQQIAIVSAEELLTRRRATLLSLFRFVGVDEGFWSSDLERLHNCNGDAPQLDSRFRRRVSEAFAQDADRLRELAGRDFPAWSL